MVTENTADRTPGGVLARLAGSYGVQLGYRDALGRVREPSRESLLAALRALGADVDGMGGLQGALREREAEAAGRLVEPVVVAWDGELPRLGLRLPGGREGVPVRLTFTLEDGTVLAADAGRVGPAFERSSGRIPWGRHRLRAEAGGRAGEAWVISAPRRCCTLADRLGGSATAAAPGSRTVPVLPGAEPESVVRGALAALGDKPWGVFAPVYALRSRRDRGAGDLADLAALARWTDEAGGSLVATLPLLASSFADDADPSPYRPVSRLFWNESFLAPEQTAEWSRCAPLHPEWQAEGWLRRQEALRALDLVDHAGVMALKQPVLAGLSRCFFESADADRRRDFEEFLAVYPHARQYAAFRAAARGAEDLSGGPALTPDEAVRYHLYCQWQMDRQLAGLCDGGRPGLLFDLPLGVHPLGFDARTWPELFASGMSTGAPPDPFFAAGQDWCTPPLQPFADRAGGYRYLSACLRTLMRHAAVVRIDHMMSFHRLFWIPEGADPKDGVYVTYPAEELYALLCCESQRTGTAVVGEDLGTVPPGVRADMRRHGVARTAVVLGGLKRRGPALMPEIPEGSVVTLETHDMVPLAGFLHGDDIEIRVETGQLDRDRPRSDAAARRRLVRRLAAAFGATADDPGSAAPAVLTGCLAAMARSAARVVMVNLEDLLLERRPQNVPGTGAEMPNWRRKIAVPVEDLPRYPETRT